MSVPGTRFRDLVCYLKQSHDEVFRVHEIPPDQRFPSRVNPKTQQSHVLQTQTQHTFFSAEYENSKGQETQTRQGEQE